MSASVVKPTVSIDPQAVETLRKLLEERRAKPPGSEMSKNLAQVAAARDEVIARYRPVFSPPNLTSLSRDLLRFPPIREQPPLDGLGASRDAHLRTTWIAFGPPWLCWSTRTGH